MPRGAFVMAEERVADGDGDQYNLKRQKKFQNGQARRQEHRLGLWLNTEGTKNLRALMYQRKINLTEAIHYSLKFTVMSDQPDVNRQQTRVNRKKLRLKLLLSHG